MGDARNQLLSHLLPINCVLTAFTTSNNIDHPKLVRVPLEDNSIGVHKVWSKTTHPTVIPPLPTSSFMNPSSESIPSPTTAWEAFYPKGSINPGGAVPGGFGFYLAGPSAFAKALEGATEAV